MTTADQWSVSHQPRTNQSACRWISTGFMLLRSPDLLVWVRQIKVSFQVPGCYDDISDCFHNSDFQTNQFTSTHRHDPEWRTCLRPVSGWAPAVRASHGVSGELWELSCHHAPPMIRSNPAEECKQAAYQSITSVCLLQPPAHRVHC